MSTPPKRVTDQIQHMWSRMLRAAMFDKRTFVDLKGDHRANGQSVTVLTLASLSYGVGFAFLTGGGNAASLGEIIRLVLFWTAWFYATLLVLSVTMFAVGTQIFGGKTSFQGLVRPLFFSASPGLLFILMLIPLPGMSYVVAAFVWGWVLMAGVFAVRYAMGFSFQRSILAFIIFFLAYVLGLGTVRSLLRV